MFSPLDQAQLYLRLKNQWSGLALTTETGAIDLDAIKRRVQDVFTDRGDDIVWKLGKTSMLFKLTCFK